MLKTANGFFQLKLITSNDTDIYKAPFQLENCIKWSRGYSPSHVLHCTERAHHSNELKLQKLWCGLATIQTKTTYARIKYQQNTIITHSYSQCLCLYCRQLQVFRFITFPFGIYIASVQFYMRFVSAVDLLINFFLYIRNRMMSVYNKCNVQCRSNSVCREGANQSCESYIFF